MNKNCVIIRYSEIALKGKNRSKFENKLIENLNFFLEKKKVNYEKISRFHGRIIIWTDEKPNLKPVFGILNYSFTKSFEFDYEILKKEMEEFSNILEKGQFFRVSVQRVDKRIGKNSVEMERELGEIIYEKTKNSVSLKKPDKNFEVELISGRAFIFDNRINAFGGLPLGTDLTSSSIINNEKDVLATLLMMRRGVVPNPIIYDKNINIDLIKEYFNTYQKIDFLNFSDDESFKYLKEKNIDSVIKGDLLEDINQDNKSDFLILRPLINFDKNSVKNELIKYGEGIY